MRVLKKGVSLRNRDGVLRLFFLGVGWAFSRLHNQTNLLIVKGDDHLLVDFGTTGPRGLEGLAGLSMGDIRTLLPTHSHSDHIGGLEELALMRRYGFSAPPPEVIITEGYQRLLWEESLRGGLGYNQQRVVSSNPSPAQAMESGLQFTDYFTPVRPSPVAGAPRETFRIDVGSIQVEIFRTLHVPQQASDWKSAAWSCGILLDGRIFYSGDTRFDPDLIRHYQSAEWFFHDCQLSPGPVHASYEELRELPAEVRGRMFLVHYGDDWRRFRPERDGFAGFAEQGVQYLF